MSKRGRPTKRRRFFQTVHPRFRKKSTSECLESTISSKRLPVSTFKDAVHLSPNDDYYLVTDSEGNIGNMRFFRPIPEPQVTEPELPKFGTWRRTLPGRIHGGVHMRNCGVSSSIQSRCKAVGAEIHSSLVKRQPTMVFYF